ncbi:unnamed protein product [Polarella glacialis]|uniref:Uncharacterized protein n=1 Tax=Polarella glacialis TaxID=89957 RepID=A0A813LPN5_POLGL|nr:unnamed protein product [Polarella glacialis]
MKRPLSPDQFESSVHANSQEIYLELLELSGHVVVCAPGGTWSATLRANCLYLCATPGETWPSVPFTAGIIGNHAIHTLGCPEPWFRHLHSSSSAFQPRC